MSRWPTMGYYAWREWCEVERAGDYDVPPVWVPGKSGKPVRWWLQINGRWDGQPPPDAYVRVPLWALAHMSAITRGRP